MLLLHTFARLLKIGVSHSGLINKFVLFEDSFLFVTKNCLLLSQTKTV
jgi:hypothetical protein